MQFLKIETTAHNCVDMTHKQEYTRRLRWHHGWLFVDFQMGNELNVCQMCPTCVHTHM